MTAHKATWTGPKRSLRLTGKPARLITRGDDFEIPDGETVGGEGHLFDITGGPEFDKLAKRAADLGITGKGKKALTTRKDLAEAIAAHEAAEQAEAEKAAAEQADSDSEE